MRLEDVKRLADGLRKSSDHRPDWLKRMPSASDPSALYYRFFFELAPELQAPKMLEIGTYMGTSAAHFAAANPSSKVVTIDHNPDAARLVDALPVKNITALTSDSALAAASSAVLDTAPFDILFIDGNHTFDQAYGEYDLYRPLVKDGGLILFDDIHLPMATKEMDVLFEFIPDPKMDISACHYTGFGAACKDPRVPIPSWASITALARKRMIECGGVFA